MKFINTISWLMDRVQKSLFPHRNQCLPAPLTEEGKQRSEDYPQVFSLRSQIIWQVEPPLSRRGKSVMVPKKVIFLQQCPLQFFL